MHKIYLVIACMLMTFSATATDVVDGEQYITLNRQKTSTPQILEFFSFYCQHCYDFEQIYQVTHKIKKALPAETKIVRYHVGYLGLLGKPLTQAWAVAIALGVEDKVSPLMFEAVQKAQTLKTSNDIRSVFVTAGISVSDYDAALNSSIVKNLVVKQEKAMQDFPLLGVPVVFVNGKYMVKNNGLDSSSIARYAQQFVDVVQFLIGK
ncbi:Thiol:disulfide interchange protein DsbA [Serratia symbiotica]|nr:Thiol:disulfide interchange protein DsbA [Serratia symbiotica]